ncbi:helix-turn-helix domain-containing protein [Treponema sp.]|uniref:helix-turn-helix domain-containing protein n=1 Tax=Treponema sp. TaxID=166 RepID=UPI002591CD97|nr:helix-turn-helix transcriptional regulator [uncultured Treponema sp.]
MNALTEYGKILRHYRIDNQILLAKMAADLGLSPAYLSSIETGTRSIPVDLTEKLCQKYGFDEEMRTALMKAEAEKNKALTVNLEGVSAEAIDATVMFARSLKNFSVKELREICEKMNEHN